jgi:hypothetical protein
MKTYNKNPEAVSLLTPERYRVTQQDGTERPFQNEYWDNKEPGLHVDVVSGEPLFASVDKFGSGAQRSLQLAGPRRISEQAALRDALLIRGPCRAALGKRAIDTRSGRHWHWQSRGATDTVRLAQPFPPRRADSLLPCREAKALGIISEIVPRDVGTNIALAK